MVSGNEDSTAPRVCGRTGSHRLPAGPTGSGAAQAQRQVLFGQSLQRASHSPGGPELTQEPPWGLDPSFLTRRPCRMVVQGGFSGREWAHLVSSALPVGARPKVPVGPRVAEGALPSAGGRSRGWAPGGLMSSFRMPALSLSVPPSWGCLHAAEGVWPGGK